MWVCVGVCGGVGVGECVCGGVPMCVGVGVGVGWFVCGVVMCVCE